MQQQKKYGYLHGNKLVYLETQPSAVGEVTTILRLAYAIFVTSRTWA
jgi:hypothetical protein